MKKTLFILVVCGLFAVSAFAQKPVDFTGSWEYDASRSKLALMGTPPPFTVTQSDKELKITRPAGKSMDGAEIPSTSDIYSLEGKVTKGEILTSMDSIESLRTAKLEAGKLKLSTSFAEHTNTEVWSLC